MTIDGQTSRTQTRMTAGDVIVIADRTREGLRAARAKGRTGGRPKGIKVR